MNHLLKLTLVIVLTALINTGNAFALTSNGKDGALVLNNAITFNVANNDVFNYTTVNLQAGSTLDFSGLNNGDSIFILGTGDMVLDGSINLPLFTSFTFQTTGNIYINGSILTSNSNLSFLSNLFSSGSNSVISDISGSITVTAGSTVVIGDGSVIDVGAPPSQTVGNGGIALNPPLFSLAPVPEPASYILLTLGFLVIVLSSRFNRANS